ncbi:MAG: GNAT family N-acetyltransferase [Gemmatimonadaceae bacterium]|nr:GNAT family N-acetyltransferase [Chitinophagaceae bacterium]
MKPEYLRYEEIDKLRWDECIANATNGLIYAQSFYLDAFSPQWAGLVLNDYEAVMPLTWKKKYRIGYLYQPAFTQQGGIFSKNPLHEETLKSFSDGVLENFRFGEFALNADRFHDILSEHISPLNNYLIDLGKDYGSLGKQYLPGFSKSLRRIKKFNLKYASSSDFNAAVDLYQNLYSKRLPHMKDDVFLSFKKVCEKLSLTGQVIIRQAFAENGQLVALVLLLNDGKRLYNLVSCITKDGKTLEANYFLYDRLIEEFAGSGLILDLEGSDQAGVAKFYEKMGGVNQPYGFVRYNFLPPLIKLLKK